MPTRIPLAGGTEQLRLLLRPTGQAANCLPPLQTLQRNADSLRGQRLLLRLRLPLTGHGYAEYRVWQRRDSPSSVHSEKKRLEKLHYMRGNPVARHWMALTAVPYQYRVPLDFFTSLPSPS